MLYGYELTINDAGKIRNYKKDNKFEHKLESIENIDLSTFEVLTNISYKQTIPLNLFEKYSLKLIKKAEDINATMDIKRIAQLLHLDENLIRENLKNLSQIDMINGFESDNISINYDENAEYIQYENKFKKEKEEKSFFLTKDEFDKLEEIVKDDFEKTAKGHDKKYLDYELTGEYESIKQVKFLKFSDNNFLIFSNHGVNHQNDLKFINNDTFNTFKNVSIKEKFFCHKEEFLPIVRDKLSMDKNDSLVIIFSKEIEIENFKLAKTIKKENDLYIFTNSDENKDKRIFSTHQELDDIFIIGQEFFIRKENFIYKIQNIDERNKVKNFINSYFLNKIKEIEPNYDINKLEGLNSEIDLIKQSISELTCKTKKEFDEKIKKINEDKNKLYGLDIKNSNQRSLIRKKLDNWDKLNNDKELVKYPKYLENREAIKESKSQVSKLELEKKALDNHEKEINKLNQEKSNLVSKENKEKVSNFEKELKNISRLNYE